MKVFFKRVSITLMVILLPALVWAKKPLTPESIPGVKVVDAAFVKTNLGKIKVFDVRKKAEYVDGHIPGAINVWYHERSKKSVDFDPSRDRFDISRFPEDKSEPIIVHCNGPHCWKSYKAIVQLKKAGYKNIYWFRGGFPEWKSKGYPVE